MNTDARLSCHVMSYHVMSYHGRLSHQRFSLIECRYSHRSNIRVERLGEYVVHEVLPIFETTIQTLSR